MSATYTTEQKREPREPEQKPKQKTKLSRKHREWLAASLFVAPDALGFFVFLGIPIILSLGMGFFQVSGFGGYSFVGLANYERMFSDPQFLNSVWVTLIYVTVFVVGVFAASLGLALLVQQKMDVRPIFRSGWSANLDQS